MAAGRQVTKAELNNRAFALVATLYTNMREIRAFQNYLAATVNQTLLDLGYSQSDIDDVKSAFADLDELRKALDGLANSKLTGTYAFRTFPDRLIGDGVF
jgi:hypothetical protein